jgi:hypothetical protein
MVVVRHTADRWFAGRISSQHAWHRGMLVWNSSAGDRIISSTASQVNGHRLLLYRLVLFLLLLPLLLLGIVVWFLLPGSVGGLTYTPTVYVYQAALQPAYWQSHSATVRGYSTPIGCQMSLPCPGFYLVATPQFGGHQAGARLWVAPQPESGWHAFLRKLLPGQITRPLPQGLQAGEQVRVSGRLLQIADHGSVLVLAPNSL